MFKVGDTIFGLIKDTHSYFDEVQTWIKSNKLQKIKPYIDTNGIRSLKDLKLHTETIINNAITDNIISDFEEAKKIRTIFNEIDPTRSARKKKPMLYLHFAQGGEKLYLDGDQLVYKLGKYTFGGENNPICPNKYYPDREVEAIIKYAKGSWWLIDPNPDEMNGVYVMLYSYEKCVLRPGTQLKLGDLEFRLERYNTAVAEKEKSHSGSDDKWKIIQDMGIDEHMKCSYFAVYDGHGGSDCSIYLQNNLHKVLKSNLIDRFDGIK